MIHTPTESVFLRRLSLYAREETHDGDAEAKSRDDAEQVAPQRHSDRRQVEGDEAEGDVDETADEDRQRAGLRLRRIGAVARDRLGETEHEFAGAAEDCARNGDGETGNEGDDEEEERGAQRGEIDCKRGHCNSPSLLRIDLPLPEQVIERVTEHCGTEKRQDTSPDIHSDSSENQRGRRRNETHNNQAENEAVFVGEIRVARSTPDNHSGDEAQDVEAEGRSYSEEVDRNGEHENALLFEKIIQNPD